MDGSFTPGDCDDRRRRTTARFPVGKGSTQYRRRGGRDRWSRRLRVWTHWGGRVAGCPRNFLRDFAMEYASKPMPKPLHGKELGTTPGSSYTPWPRLDTVALAIAPSPTLARDMFYLGTVVGIGAVVILTW